MDQDFTPTEPRNEPIDHSLFRLLADNYACLQRHYRLGNFEGSIPLLEPHVIERGTKTFFRLDRANPDLAKGDSRRNVSFQDAIDSLKDLTLELAKLPGDLDHELLLRCKCLIYEAKDYLLETPTEFVSEFLEHAERFAHYVDVEKVRQLAVELNGKPFDDEDKDHCAKVIKLQIIAALCGINIMYRRHDPEEQKTALIILERMISFVTFVLPDELKMRRESFGLLGLAHYLNGRILTAIGSLDAARTAFHDSAEAYVNRIRQKERLYYDERSVSDENYDERSVSDENYREKVSVTLRRAALVTAFGDGHLSLLNSQVRRALESLTLARAALSLNSGLIYLEYVDVLYYSCQRAQRSSNREVLDDVIVKVGECRDRLQNLLKRPNYVHRAGIQLALAHYYRAELADEGGAYDFKKGLEYLEEAIDFAKPQGNGPPAHAPIYSEALTIMARFHRALYRKYRDSDPKLAQRYLQDAETEADKACAAGEGLKVLAAEAHVTRGDVYKDLTEANSTKPQGRSTFRADFKRAVMEYERALELNDSENRRIEGLCLLRLAKLCLLDPSSEDRARKYYEDWLQIEPEVEHEYCHRLAKDLEARLDEPPLLVDARKSLDYADWNEKLLTLLVERAIKEDVEESQTKKLSLSQEAISRRIKTKLTYNRKNINAMFSRILDNEKIASRVRNMIENPLRAEPDKEVRRSFVTQRQRSNIGPAVESFVALHGDDIRKQNDLAREQLTNMLIDHVSRELRCTKPEARRFLTQERWVEKVWTIFGK